ncbi:hypothetical protein AB0K14_40785 [Actinosynnema sp. NPDC050801]|uniref:NACHT and WD repeat domain-containing protein n=1 Tax=unclassified Actinosynnema TaxID=2637065 RepID=UPI003400DC78
MESNTDKWSVPSPVNHVNLEANAANGAVVYQSGRDSHLHFHDGTGRTRRLESGVVVDACPYPGLAAFGPGEARWFFGRDRTTADLLGLLGRRAASGGVQVVVAPSGAGKSSLLRAGLLPRLHRQALPGSRTWPKSVFTPTAQPLRSLAVQLAPLIGAHPTVVAEALVSHPEWCAGRLRGRHPASRVLLVVDQFEELFTLCADEGERHAFVDVLSRLAAPTASGADVLVVIGVRADFYGTCADYPALRVALQDSPVVLGPMSYSELREAIVYPARAAGLDIEPGLVELLLRDLGATEGATGYEAGRLPLLAHALRGAWYERHGATLTVDGYRTTGGIERAIAQTADQVHARLDPVAQGVARSLFLRLVKIGDGTDDARCRLSRAELVDTGDNPVAAAAVLDAFTAKRLLTRHRDAVEITHEALIRAWPVLRGWLDKDRDGLLVHQRLTDAAATWERKNRPPDALYRGVVLADARAAAEKRHVVLSPSEQEFLAAGRHAQQRDTRRRRRMVGGLAVVTVLALVFAGMAAYSASVAATAEREARAQQLVAQGEKFSAVNPRASVLFALASWNTAHTPESRGAVLSTQTNPYDGTTELGGPLFTVAATADGQLIATGGEEGIVRLLSPADRTVVREMDLGRPVTALAFSRDKVLAATTAGPGTPAAPSEDGGTEATGKVVLWPDAMSDAGRKEFDAGQGDLFEVAFSADGASLATAGADPGIKQWVVGTGEPHGPAFGDNGGPVFDVAYRPCDGCTEIVAGTVGAVRRWDRVTGRPLGTSVVAKDARVLAVDFNADGSLLATGGDDQSARLWDGGTGALLDAMAGHDLSVNDVAFAPGESCGTSGNQPGCTLMTVSFDLTTRLWNVTREEGVVTSAERTTLESQDTTAFGAVFVGGSFRVVTANDNGTLGWWSVDRSQVSSTGAVNDIAFTDDGKHGVSVDATGGVLTNYWGGDGKFLRGPNAVYTDVSFSGSGNRVAVAGGSEMANVSDFDRVGVVLNGHWSTAAERPGTVHAITFGADDDTVFTGDTTGKVNRWDVEITDGGTTLRNPVELKAPGTGAAHQNAVCGMAIDDNRTTLVTGGFDHVARLWNAADGTPKGKPLVGHHDLVCGVAFDRTGEVVATASFDNTVRLWDARTGDPLGEPLVGHTGPVLSVAFDGRGKLASGSYDRTVRLWEVADPAAPTPWAALTGHRDKVNVVRFRPGTAELHTGGDDRTVRVWRLDFVGPDGVLADACEQVRGDLTRAGLEEHTPELDPDEHLSMCDG